LPAGCATTSPGYRTADRIASESSFKKEYIKTGLSNLTAYYNFTSPGKPLTIYIEGDGKAWRSRREISEDPTPDNDLVISLATSDRSPNIAYLARPGQLALDLGKRWAVEQVYVKVYPCCAWIQATVQQLVAMRGAHPVKAEEVKKLRIGVCSYAARNNGNVAPPDTMGAQYSLPYCAALAVTADPREPSRYFGEQLDEPSRRALAQRIELTVDPEMEAAYPKHYGARVHLELANGARHDSAVLDPHGMPSDPCSDEERLAKFRLLVRHRMSDARAAQLIDAVRSVEHLRSVRELTGMMRLDQRDLVET